MNQARRRKDGSGEKTEKYTKQALGTAKEQCERLLAKNYKFKNLNPYLVLQLDIDASLEDIKFRYKKMSVLVHPDKNQGLEQAQEAFEEVKTAYNLLLKEGDRDKTIGLIELTRENTEKERRKLLSKGMKEADLEPLDTKTVKDVAKAFADVELRRRESEAHLATSRKREREQEDEAKAKEEDEKAFNEAYSKGERRDKRVGNWRDFQQGPVKRHDVANFKQQERGDSKKPKFGAADMESWKKSWK